MHPVNFPGAREVTKPENMTDEQCFSVYATTTDYNYTGSDGLPPIAVFTVDEEGKCNDAG